MELHTTLFERALHFFLFLSAAVAFGVVALFVLERLVDEGRRTIFIRHVAIAVAVFAAFGIAERLYHLVH